MSKTALAGLLLIPVIVFLQSNNKAEALELTPQDITKLAYVEPPVIATFEVPELAQAEEKPETPKPEIIQHTVAENESLSKIATQHNTTWKRLFDKNTAVEHPDVINVGEVLVIPSADETIPERPLPVAPEPVIAAAAPASKPASKPAASRAPARVASVARGSSTGNLYVPGYCTWYVKNRRPSLPNNLGNADTWVSRAAAQGMATGSTPRAGAVGQRGMHVVYVESVNSDGTVNISEMNHKGRYVITHRTLPANYFTYIY